MQELRSSLDHLREANSGLAEDLLAKEQAQKTAEAKLQDLQLKLEIMADDSHSRVTLLTQQVTNLTAATERLQGQCEDYSAQTQQLSRGRDHLQETVTTLEGKLRVASEQLEARTGEAQSRSD